MATIDKKWLVELKGKQFVLFAGLLDVAHNSGLIAIENEVVLELSAPAEDRWVVRSTGRFRGPEGEAIWSAHGDAYSGNSQMRGAYLRHAETRAAARMLRMATNIGMCSVEELGPDVEDAPHKPRSAAPPAVVSNDQQLCKVCGVEMTAREIDGCKRKGIPPHCTAHAAEIITKIIARPAV